MTGTELDRIRATRSALERARLAQEYVVRHRQAVVDGVAVRDAAVVVLAGRIGATATARATGLSLVRVKQLRKAAGGG